MFSSFFFSQNVHLCKNKKITVRSEPYNPFFFMLNLTENHKGEEIAGKVCFSVSSNVWNDMDSIKRITHIFYDLPVKWGKENWMRFICQEPCLACHCNKFSSFFILRTQITPDLLLLNLWNVLISKLNVVAFLNPTQHGFFLMILIT